MATRTNTTTPPHRTSSRPTVSCFQPSVRFFGPSTGRVEKHGGAAVRSPTSQSTNFYAGHQRSPPTQHRGPRSTASPRFPDRPRTDVRPHLADVPPHRRKRARLRRRKCVDAAAHGVRRADGAARAGADGRRRRGARAAAAAVPGHGRHAPGLPVRERHDVDVAGRAAARSPVSPVVHASFSRAEVVLAGGTSGVGLWVILTIQTLVIKGLRRQ